MRWRMTNQQPNHLCLVTNFVLAVASLLVFQGALYAAEHGSEVDVGSHVQPPKASVPAPPSLDLPNLGVPTCWTCAPHELVPLEFSLDLDLLAPLGTGEGNAAVYFKDFAKPNGSRADEVVQDRVRGLVNGKSASIYPPDHPLLLEAEGWVDQSNCNFYPDVWALEGMSTQLPNLLHFLTLGKSWIARGQAEQNAEAARDDFRRTVRLGRLLLQDDVQVAVNQIGLELIRMGAEAMYRQANMDKDLSMLAVSAVILGDTQGIRMLGTESVEKINAVADKLDKGMLGYSMDVSESEVEDLISIVQSHPERSFRIDAISALHTVTMYGPRSARKSSKKVLTEAVRDEDELVAGSARWHLQHPNPDSLYQ